MTKFALGATAIIAALTLPAIAFAQDEPEGAPSPNQIVEEAAVEEWVSIPAEDLLVLTLASPDRGSGQASAEGSPREVIIQLMPPPFSQGWVHNIKLLAREGWYDGISVNRVQDNYVVQWGDPNYDNPEADGQAKSLPEGLKVMGEEEYSATNILATEAWMASMSRDGIEELLSSGMANPTAEVRRSIDNSLGYDAYSQRALFSFGWPLAQEGGEPDSRLWPVHCYGMVGVGRGYSPDTGSGAELYTVIGHAPRHLDRNIALVGRIIEGMEHLSSLPRGNGVLGFYAEDEEDKRTPILSIDVAADVEGADYSFEYLSTEGKTFAKYAEARANRRDPFFIVPAGGADICNIPVPVRRVVSE